MRERERRSSGKVGREVERAKIAREEGNRKQISKTYK